MQIEGRCGEMVCREVQMGWWEVQMECHESAYGLVGSTYGEMGSAYGVVVSADGEVCNCSWVVGSADWEVGSADRGQMWSMQNKRASCTCVHVHTCSAHFELWCRWDSGKCRWGWFVNAVGWWEVQIGR